MRIKDLIRMDKKNCQIALMTKKSLKAMNKFCCKMSKSKIQT